MKYRINHKAWDVRDDSTEFIPSVSLYLGFPAISYEFIYFFAESLTNHKETIAMAE